VLVDLGGDLPAALGLPDPDGPGAAEWSRAECGEDPGPLLMPVNETLSLLPLGRGPLDDLPLGLLAALHGEVVVDGGCVLGPDSPAAAALRGAARSLLVARPCYLALRRVSRVPLRPDGVVLVTEPGRSLSAADVAAVVGAPVVAEVGSIRA
jgi:hypothetical protein